MHLENFIQQGFQTRWVSMTPNPFQGLKLMTSLEMPLSAVVSMTPNPFQGLKHFGRMQP